MTRDQELAHLIRKALKPRLIQVAPAGGPNAGASSWEQPGAEEVAVALADLVVFRSELTQVGFIGADNEMRDLSTLTVGPVRGGTEARTASSHWSPLYKLRDADA